MAGINIIQAAETKGSLRHDQPGAWFLWSSLPGKGCIKFLIYVFFFFFFLYILPHSFAKSYLWCSVGSNLYWNREVSIQTHTDSEAGASVWCVGHWAASLEQSGVICLTRGCFSTRITSGIERFISSQEPSVACFSPRRWLCFHRCVLCVCWLVGLSAGSWPTKDPINLLCGSL